MRESISISRALLVRLGAVAAAVVVLFLGADAPVDRAFEDGFRQVAGEETLAEEIVLVRIDREDIDRLRWPLKRNYYALLVRRLSELNVRVLGLEVFLAPNVSFQSAYTDLLNDEIRKSGAVVLGSIVERIVENDEGFRADTVLLPQPAIELARVPTGHLSYLRGERVAVPLVVETPARNEQSFALATAREAGFEPQAARERKLVVNMRGSWKSFRQFGLIEFLRLAEQEDARLDALEGKIVLTGVVAPDVATSMPGTFDESVPGLALHAFALDNLLADEGLNDSWTAVSRPLFALLALAFGLFLAPRRRVSWFVASAIALLFGWFALFIFGNVLIAGSWFLLPFLAAALAESGLAIAENRAALDERNAEAAGLRESLGRKEERLAELEARTASGKSDVALAERVADLRAEVETLRKREREDEEIAEIDDDDLAHYHGIVYQSAEMRKAISTIEKAASSDAPVLILGESGSGKELAARAVHEESERREGPFVAVNCAALADTLLESELFGHVKGAFTGAVADKKGRFEAANGGSIFLDEIGETSEAFQTKLLRVLQSGEFEKVGSPKTIETDARVIAATNRDVKKLVAEKRFREDLYYRINVVAFELPPLRRRKRDIEPLADFFLSRESPDLSISKTALAALKEHEWRGNVRELEAAMKRAAVFAKSDGRTLVRFRDLPEQIGAVGNVEEATLESLRAKGFARNAVNETAKETGVGRTAVAERLRGAFLRRYVEKGFDREAAIDELAGDADDEARDRLAAKADAWLTNVERDVRAASGSFEEVKSALSAKYKNLPKDYHAALDEILRRALDQR
jgi:DNA-binding NtrC family response regulator/CHASE2 domain-containing sensor protein